jgi:hypothetical protein
MASIGTVPRRCPSVHHGVRPVPVGRSGLDGAAWTTHRELAPNLLPSTDVRHQGTARSEDCVRRKLRREWRRHREATSKSGQQCRRVRHRRHRASQYWAVLVANRPGARHTSDRSCGGRPANAAAQASTARPVGVSSARSITDPHPIERLTRIHRDDHRRRIKRNLQHRHEQPPPNRTSSEDPLSDYSWPISPGRLDLRPDCHPPVA